MTESKANRKIDLECGHYLWYKTPIPNVHEILWCPYCRDERKQAMADAHYADSYQDDWLSQRKGRKYVGTCLMDGDGKEYCEHQIEKANWYDLRRDMERHQFTAHKTSSLLANLTFTEVQRLPKTAAPDF